MSFFCSMPRVPQREVFLDMLLQEAVYTHDLYMQELDPDSEDDLDSNSSASNSSSTSDSSSSDDDRSDIEVDDAEEEYMARMRRIEDCMEEVLSNRVLFPNIDPVPHVPQLELVLIDYRRHETSEKRFRRNLRCSPTTFDAIVARIQDHAVFQNNSNMPQLPVEHQLAIALWRFGHAGNSSSVEDIAQWAGVSAGMVVNSTRRVIIAVLSHHDDTIHWPTTAEKEEAKEWVESVSCPAWRDGFCMVDGTLVPLFEKPGYHGETYFDRKSNYSLNVQVTPCLICRQC